MKDIAKALTPLGLGVLFWYLAEHQSFTLAFVIFTVIVLYGIIGLEERLDRIANAIDFRFKGLQHLDARYDDDDL